MVETDEEYQYSSLANAEGLSKPDQCLLKEKQKYVELEKKNIIIVIHTAHFTRIYSTGWYRKENLKVSQDL